MGVVKNQNPTEAPKKVQSWINGLSQNFSTQLMESNCSCGCSNGFEEERGTLERKPSLLSLERMDESTGSEETKIEQFVSNLQLASARSLRYSYSSPRSDYEYDDDSDRNFFTPSSSFSIGTTSDSDSQSLSTSRSIISELNNSFKSLTPTPLQIPPKTLENSDDTTPTSKRRSTPTPSDEEKDQNAPASERRPIPISFSDDEKDENTPASDEESSQKDESAPAASVNLEGNSLIWLPPPAADEDLDTENCFYEYEEEEFDNGFFVNSASDEDGFGDSNPGLTSQKEALRSALRVHFKVLVAQLLEGQGLKVGNENPGNGNPGFSWLEIISGLAWEAAGFVKPDTSKGDSMDPANYVKVKCIASGNPNDSTFVKGVVCSKNVKHKRMVSQHRNPKLLLLGGELEYQKKLASLNSALMEQEKDYLKAVVSQIEAQKPNVLLIEKSASPYAQEILSKDISLVLNVKRKLLEGIARCTGAQIADSMENIGAGKTGRCIVFRTEKVSTECVGSDGSVKKTVKTLMFFEGCPKRLGCTVLLRGGNLAELKKLKHVVQFAVFAAYHLSLETSFLADEGAFLPKTLNPPFPNGSYSLPNGSDDSEEMTGGESGLEESKSDGEQKGSSNSNNEIFSESQQSILVNLSMYDVKGSGEVCEQSRFYRIKFYGSFDKPLGRFLRDDLFGQPLYCESCNEPTEHHVRCYTHQQGSLTISMKRLTSSCVTLPGQRDGKIWMWHRCLRCKPSNGVPVSTPRVVMSSSAWGLSFGKFLELSFSNHATANRVANCGHSLQRDCLRFYGCGNMVAVFRYSPVDILAVNLPPAVMDFTNRVPIQWMRHQISDICGKADCLYMEIFSVLNRIENSMSTSHNETLISSIREKVSELRDEVQMEKDEYKVLLDLNASETVQPPIDVLELNRWRRWLLNNAFKWDQCLFNLDSHSKGNPSTLDLTTTLLEASSSRRMEDSSSPKLLECNSNSIVEMDLSIEGLSMVSGQFTRSEQEETLVEASSETLVSDSSSLSDKIDLHWTGSTNQLTDPFGSFNLSNNPSIKKALAPVKLLSFDSALTRAARDQFPNIRRAYSQRSPKFDDLSSAISLQNQPSIQNHMLSASFMILPDGARIPKFSHTTSQDIVIDLYDDELTSIIASAMTSHEYQTFISPPNSQTLEETLTTHFRVSFDDGGSFHTADKGRYSVTCYFAKQFDVLRKACCPSETDFVRSMSRCKKWSAHGGKSNAYFAKTLDERFIIKQVTRTELESFEDFAGEYFKYMTESLGTGSPTSLAKVVGLYQVVAKNLRGGRETKIDFMVMENLFFGRNVARIYDLKGSLRSRYNHDAAGDNKVLLDLNLLETLHTKPIFLGSKSKRWLERAVWNDTSFLATVDVMDYSLLVGIDEEKKELVIGIIDYLRQYTWDKQLETWVKASGILGGPKNTSPTVISPSLYKKRFRKAMSKYFLTLHNQWSS
ncbi:hypothetical protein LUZ60_000205 [Juncus effusus]|nr:hypothetical protein LUZ60_000205 [Juncus effusus]